MSTYNKQPIFAATPILKATLIEPLLTAFTITDITSSSSNVFMASADEGTLIDRITITAKSDSTNNTVSEKLIYITIYDSESGVLSVIKVIHFPATTVSDNVPPPSESIVFQGGIIFKKNDVIFIGQSQTGNNGDGLYIVVEGGTYTQA